jgi:hypothetical protein
MPTDNTRLNPGEGGDLSRTTQRVDDGPKTQVMQMDVGGGGPTEKLLGDANPMPVGAASLPLPTGAATEATASAVAAGLGAPADAAAGSDTGTAGVVALFKRALQNWTTLLARIPALVGGRMPVDGSGVTQPVSGPVTDAQLRAAAVPVSGPVTDAQLRAAAVPVSGPVTDAQLRADPVPSRLSAYNYPISTANSSTTQLAAGASFTGDIEAPQDQPSLSILMTSDQPMTVTVRQFIDLAGTFAVPDIVFYVPASANFARSLTINGNFLRVIAQNTGAATTTTFNLNCAFGSLGDSDSTGTQPVTELPLVLTGAAAQTAVVNNILAPTAGAAGLSVAGYRAASVQVVSTGTGGTFIFEQSNDGTSWVALPVFNAALVTGVPITAAITASASQIVYTFPIRCNFLRLRIATTITGGSIRAFSRLSTEPWTGAAQLVASNTAANLLAQVSGSLTATLAAATVRAGFLAGAGIWYDDTSTALGAGATFTGTSRDATVTATATAFANAATYAQEVSLSAEQDVTFTLALEVSRDNTNWRRVKAVAASAVTGGAHYAEIVHRPSWRYWRLLVVNGAGAAARTTAGSIAKAI